MHLLMHALSQWSPGHLASIAPCHQAGGKVWCCSVVCGFTSSTSSKCMHLPVQGTSGMLARILTGLQGMHMLRQWPMHTVSNIQAACRTYSSTGRANGTRFEHARGCRQQPCHWARRSSNPPQTRSSSEVSCSAHLSAKLKPTSILCPPSTYISRSILSAAASRRSFEAHDRA